MTPEERASAIAAAVGGATLSFSQGGVNFTVSDVSAVGPAVRYYAIAWTGQGANRVYLPVDLDWTFRPYDGSGRGEYEAVNPPLMPPDGGFDPDGRKTYTRDDITAAKVIVYDAVTGYATRNGWVMP